MFPLSVGNQGGGVCLLATVGGVQVAEGYSEVAQLVAVAILLRTLSVPERRALTTRDEKKVVSEIRIIFQTFTIIMLIQDDSGGRVPWLG